MYSKYTQYPVYLFLLILGLVTSFGCSTKKNGWAHRTYHNTTSRYNGYFNAKEIIRTKVAAHEIALEDDYNYLLPVFEYGTNEDRQPLFSDMETAITKAEKMIKRHSIEIRGKQYVKWIDNCYFVIGQAHFYKGEYDKAKQFFNYVSKKFKDEDSQSKALLYLIRVYLEEEDFERAENLLRKAETLQLDKHELADLRLIYADMYIRQKNYKLAIPELSTAVPLIRKKRHRVRIVYLLGQLYKQEGENGRSTEMFAQVIKMHPDYKMTFYAKIQMAMAYNGQPGGKEEVRKQLLKMLADEKYIEFRDQIYYALAEMEFQDGNVEETLDLLTKSTEVSVSNDQQKARSFLRKGEIYFDRLKYEAAQTNYDSCVAFLSPDYPDYDEVIKIAENLNDLVTQIRIINHEDSVQMVAKMSPAEREAHIEKLIEVRKEEEEEKRRQEQLKAELEEGGGFAGNGFGGPGGPGGGPRVPGVGGGNQWYFYNPSARGLGAAEFKKVWGSRKNEDNWRRSNKNTVSFEDGGFADEEDGGVLIDENGDTIKVSKDWQDPSFYLKDLPLSDEKLLASNDRMLTAYYKLANVYWDQLEDNLKTIETLEKMNERFNPNEHQLAAYYSLYRLHGTEDHTTEEDFYKNKILSEYPETDYAKLIRDPEYFKKENQSNQDVVILYERVYNYYQKGLYVYTIQQCDEGLAKYGDSELAPNFKLLKVMSMGQTEGKEKMVSELTKLKSEYKDHEVGEKAGEILVQLEVAALEAKEREAREAAEAERKARGEEFPFSYEPDGQHNCIILISSKAGKTSIMKNRISSFNSTVFRSAKLKTSSVLFSDELQMVTIKSFKNADEVKRYVEAFNNEKKKLKGVNDKGFDVFGISYNNYAIFYKEKDVELYKEFYNLNYNQSK